MKYSFDKSSRPGGISKTLKLAMTNGCESLAPQLLQKPKRIRGATRKVQSVHRHRSPSDVTTQLFLTKEVT